MENLRDKMLDEIRESHQIITENFKNGISNKKYLNELIAESCARVAEEEIAKAFDWAYCSGLDNGKIGVEGKMGELRDKYLKSLK